MNREAFEKIPEIAQLIEEGEDDNLIFIPETNMYDAEMYITFTPDYVHFLNGCWIMYCYEQDRVSKVLEYVRSDVRDGNIADAIEAVLQ